MTLITLIVGGKTFSRVSQRTVNRMLDSMPDRSYCTWLDQETLFIDRKPLWMEYIIDHYRGYNVDFDEMFDSSVYSPEQLQILKDDMQFFGVAGDELSVDIEKIKELIDNWYLETENPELHRKLQDALEFANLADMADIIDEAERVVAFAEYKECVVSWIMSTARQGLRMWGSRTGMDTDNLKQSISKRLEEDDKLMRSFYDFSETMRSYPFLSWTVDSARMFVVNYFVKAQCA